MNPNPNPIDIDEIIGLLAGPEIWQSEPETADACLDVPGQVLEALRQPADFPPLEQAIVSGDRVAIAIDPNIPGILEVVEGVVAALRRTDAEQIEIVLGDEAADETVAAIEAQVDDDIHVTRHRSTEREAVRFLGADERADPIYLNRSLVDADFVLPIVAGRPLDTRRAHDLTGVFPAFADSASRRRYRRQLAEHSDSAPPAVHPQEAAWMLGVLLMVCVTATSRGQAARIIAGTPAGVAGQLSAVRHSPDESPRSAELVIAALDGSTQQQTWCNAARAVAAASRYVQPEGTIVLWSAIDEAPQGRLKNLADEDGATVELEMDESPTEDSFPDWDESTGSAQTLARVASQHRLLIHSRLDEETIESMGLGSIESPQQLARLSQSYESCAVIRAAQYAGTTFDAPRQMA